MDRPAELVIDGSDFEEIGALRPTAVTGGVRGDVAFSITRPRGQTDLIGRDEY